MHRISRMFLLSFIASAPALSVAAVPALAQATGTKTLTVERIYAPPSLSGSLTQGIEWSPDSKRISYLERKGEGKDATAEMWTMDATTGERRMLVSAEKLKSVMQPEKTKAIQATGLGRAAVERYQWSPDGNALLFVGSSNLALLDLKTMSAKSLVAGEKEIDDARFSPDGRWVSYVQDSNVRVVNVASGESHAVTNGGGEELLKGTLDWVYPEELDTRTAYWWSPDSSKIAYYEMDERPVTRYPIMDMSSPIGAMEYTRYPQAGEANPIVHVGVVSVSGGDTKWMDTGANTDVYLPRVDWLPDSRRIAVQRLNRAQTQLDLLLCDASTGASQKILTEMDKYWINISDDLYFFRDGSRFLWSSERTGFRHLYVYDLSGKELAQLTSGDWEISGTGGFGPGSESHPAVDEARGFVYFLSNKDDVRESQLYRVSLKDKSVIRLTHEAGVHLVSIAPDESAMVDTYSNAMTPPRQELDRIDGKRLAVITENKAAEFAEYKLSPVEFLNVTAEDGTKLNAEMIKPTDFDPAKKYPVLIDVYGGPHAQVVRNAWEGTKFLFLEMMAERGYLVFSLDNRGSWGRGHAFETPIFHRFGEIELEDQLAGVRYLKSLPYVNASRIGIWGWSYGGFMTLNALFNAPDVFEAGVSVAPVSDWRLYDTIYTERYMGRPQDNPEGYKNSSPANQAGQLKGKLMMVHGTGDDNVHFANTSLVLNQLIQAGKYPDELVIFPGRGHPIGDPPARIELFRRIAEFFLKSL